MSAGLWLLIGAAPLGLLLCALLVIGRQS